MDRNWNFGNSNQPTPAAASAAQDYQQNALEQWLVSRILKKGVPSLSQEEVNVIFSSMQKFETEWHKITKQPLPENVRHQIADRVQQSSQNKFKSTIDQIPLFHKAVMQGDYEAVRGFLSKNSKSFVAAEDATRKTAVHMACKDGYADIVQVLADHSADLEVKDRTGRTPLHIACEYGQAKCVNLLLKYNVKSLEVQDGLGRNPFHLASCGESVQSIEYMVNRKPKLLNATDRNMRTGLFYSVLNANKSGAGEVKNYNYNYNKSGAGEANKSGAGSRNYNYINYFLKIL